MRITGFNFLTFAFAGFLLLSCNNNKETTITGKEEKITEGTKPAPPVTANDVKDMSSPGFADPQLKQYYAHYTAYLKKLVNSIQNKDEAGTMKIFTEEGPQFSKANGMEEKARAADERAFTDWAMQTLPDQRIIVGSAYYKKWNKEYYKRVKEKFEKSE